MQGRTTLNSEAERSFNSKIGSRPATQVSDSIDAKRLNQSRDKSIKQDNDTISKKKDTISHKATIETNPGDVRKSADVSKDGRRSPEKPGERAISNQSKVKNGDPSRKISKVNVSEVKSNPVSQETTMEGKMLSIPQISGPPLGQNRSPYSTILMSKRIMNIREENEAILRTNDLGEDIEKYQESIDQIIQNNLYMYSEKQLLPFMRSFFSRKKAMELPAGHGTKLLLQGLKE